MPNNICFSFRKCLIVGIQSVLGCGLNEKSWFNFLQEISSPQYPCEMDQEFYPLGPSKELVRELS
jgi:hypothetical protein